MPTSQLVNSQGIGRNPQGALFFLLQQFIEKMYPHVARPYEEWIVTGVTGTVNGEAVMYCKSKATDANDNGFPVTYPANYTPTANDYVTIGFKGSTPFMVTTKAGNMTNNPVTSSGSSATLPAGGGTFVSTGGTPTVTIPTSVRGAVFYVRNGNSTGGVTVAAQSGAVNGSTSLATIGAHAIYVADGTNLQQVG